MRRLARRSTRRLLAIAVTAALLSVSAGTAEAVAGGPGTERQDDAVLLQYARDTWRSMTASVEPGTHLIADNIDGTLRTRSRYTSPTNIGAYLWSTVAARDLGIIRDAEARRRIGKTLDALARLKRHEYSGMFYNWYDPVTGEVLRTWPENGDPVHPFLSTVDNGWLAAALMVVRQAMPSLRDRAQALLEPMDFGFYYNAESRGPDIKAGAMRGGFWDEEPPGCSVRGNYRGRGPDVFYTCHHYDTLNSETRIAGYVAMARGQVPREHYFALWRTLPDTCDFGWAEMKPTGPTRTYLGIPVFEGVYDYHGFKVVPTWGGDMFEALMPDLFVPEASWGPRSWRINHPRYVRAQIHHGLEDAKYGYWGFSPASNPAGGYREYGVDALGQDTDGYTSDQERTSVDYGFGDCRPAKPEPASYGDGVVTPHASFLALPYAKQAAMDNLAKLRTDFDGYGPGGFYDSIAVRSKTVAKRYLALDQGMIMGALGNVLARGALHRYFTHGEAERVLKPLLAVERFGF
ncbi:glucoamylase family protein [Thermopolyspora sp. NPDC052614]|uniref:glucoamylase family protein n=1 Tax=Thermopolyspora sp. NPDC052614 TaxID=3155682 RepID=UPI00343B4FF6